MGGADKQSMNATTRNSRERRLPVRFDESRWFEVQPLPVAPFRVERENALEQLKRRLLGERLAEVLEPGLNSLVRRAANDAAALAWATPYPLLVFPELFAERVRAAAVQFTRQEQVLRRSRELMVA